MKEQNEHCRKTSYKKVGYDLKLVIIDQIQYAQISINHASDKYQVSRASIYYWLKRYSTLEQKKQGMSKKDEIKLYNEIRLHLSLDYQTPNMVYKLTA